MIPHREPSATYADSSGEPSGNYNNTAGAANLNGSLTQQLSSNLTFGHTEQGAYDLASAGLSLDVTQMVDTERMASLSQNQVSGTQYGVADGDGENQNSANVVNFVSDTETNNGATTGAYTLSPGAPLSATQTGGADDESDTTNYSTSETLSDGNGGTETDTYSETDTEENDDTLSSASGGASPTDSYTNTADQIIAQTSTDSGDQNNSQSQAYASDSTNVSFSDSGTDTESPAGDSDSGNFNVTDTESDLDFAHDTTPETDAEGGAVHGHPLGLSLRQF